MKAIEKFTLGNKGVEILFDPHPNNPREDFNVCTMACNHRRYNLGDTQLETSFSTNWEEAFMQHIADVYELDVEDPFNMSGSEIKRVHKYIEENIIYKPLSLYEHSGLAIKVGVTSGWDSGQVGWAYIHRKDAIGLWGISNLTQRVRDKALKAIKLEVEEYNSYLSGQMYMVAITKENPYTKMYEDGTVKKGVDQVMIHSSSGFFSLESARNYAVSEVDNL